LGFVALCFACWAPGVVDWSEADSLDLEKVQMKLTRVWPLPLLLVGLLVCTLV